MFSLLYVDDEPNLLEIGQIFLESTGEFKVKTVLSGEEALAELTKNPYDAIIADYQMPEMDGIELLKNVRRSSGDIPFILFTGRGREEVVIEAINNGADFYLQKGGDPNIQFAELAHQVRQVVTRRRAERAQESEERYRILSDFAFDGVLIQDFSGKILYVNPRILRMFGIPDPALVIGKNILDFISPEFRETVIRDMQNVITGTDRYLQTYRAWAPDGKGIWIESIGTKIQYQGEPANIVALRDVTGRKQAEEALHRANEKLNLLNSITRHDVANQLTIVLGYTQLAQHTKPDPVIKGFLAKIERAVSMIQRQIEFTRTYQELGVETPAWYSIRDVVKAAEPQNLTVTCSCGSLEIFADPMLEKVFFNLFDNAVRHGERVTAITVSCEIAGEEMVITVQDNGIGIPLDVKPKIFEKGYGKNTGFGLFLAREILAITGIFIHETGTHGKGARFEIAVPKGAYRSREDRQ
jgi:PAS domain S-box-containing protein